MKKFFQEKPWYFALVVLTWVIQSIFEQIVLFFVDEKVINEWMNTPVLISDIVPWALCGIVFIVCTVVFVFQQLHAKAQSVSPSEISTLNDDLIKIVEREEYIESMQAFQYRATNGQGKKFLKLTYLAGAVDEQIEINTILQTYFYFSYPIYKKINTVSGYHDKYLNETDPTKKEDYYTAFLDEGNKLCKQILEILGRLDDVNQIEEYHCDLYRVLAKILPTISKQAIESFLQKSEVEQCLIKRKKTGILGAMVINDLYIFKNQTSLSKSDRIYFTFPYDTKKHIVFLGSINTSCFSFDNSTIIESYCKRIADDICCSKAQN